MRELALFAGAGGGILGGLLLGWRTICAVELDAYCRSVLLSRQRDGILPPFPIWDDVRTFDGRPWRGHVDVISGGFPCQDISCAGTGTGITGERSGLWREFARIICEVGPRFVFVENSPMLTTRGLGVVLGALADLGFDAEWGVLGADDVGAPHHRKRMWIVANHRERERERVLRDADSNSEPALSEHAPLGWLPTPTALNYGSNQGGAAGRVGNVRPSLHTMARHGKWPTPKQRDWRKPGGAAELARHSPDLPTMVGGPLNPTWVEWLMGWPLGWTDCAPLETGRFQSWQQSHSRFLRSVVGGIGDDD